MDQSDISQPAKSDVDQVQLSKKNASPQIGIRTWVILGVLLLSFFCISTYIVFTYLNARRPNTQQNVNMPRVVVPPLIKMQKYTTDLYYLELPWKWDTWQESDRSGRFSGGEEDKVYFEIVGFRDTSISAADENINSSEDDPRIESRENLSKNDYDYQLITWKKETEIANQLLISDGKHLISMETNLKHLKEDTEGNKVLDSFRFTGLDLSHDWIQYTNPALKVSFKYPKSGNISEGPEGHLEIRGEDKLFFYIKVTNSLKNASSYMDCSDENYTENGECVTLEPGSTLDGVPARNFFYGCGIDCGYYIYQLDNPRIEFELSDWAGDNDIYEAFLRTVRFTK